MVRRASLSLPPFPELERQHHAATPHPAVNMGGPLIARGTLLPLYSHLPTLLNPSPAPRRTPHDDMHRNRAHTLLPPPGLLPCPTSSIYPHPLPRPLPTLFLSRQQYPDPAAGPTRQPLYAASTSPRRGRREIPEALFEALPGSSPGYQGRGEWKVGV